jgi:thioredoxin-like negative regulator of GroEL
MTEQASIAPSRPVAAPKPRLLVFGSKTSGACRRVDGYLAEVLQRRHNHEAFDLTQIDVDQQPDLATQFQVTAVPTLIVVTDDTVRVRLEGPRGPTAIRRGLFEWLKH